MAKCPVCNHYAYYRVDGSMRCVSCNYDDQIIITSNQSAFIQAKNDMLKSEFKRHDAGLTAEEYQRKIRGLI